MREAGKEPPRGIGVTEDGEWAVPVIFGVDAESRSRGRGLRDRPQQPDAPRRRPRLRGPAPDLGRGRAPGGAGDAPDAGALLASLDAERRRRAAQRSGLRAGGRGRAVPARREEDRHLPGVRGEFLP